MARNYFIFFTQLGSADNLCQSVPLPPPFGEFVYPGNLVVFSKLSNGPFCIAMVTDMLGRLAEAEAQTLEEMKREGSMVKQHQAQINMNNGPTDTSPTIMPVEEDAEEKDEEEDEEEDEEKDEEEDEEEDEEDEVDEIDESTNDTTNHSKDTLLAGCGLYDARAE